MDTLLLIVGILYILGGGIVFLPIDWKRKRKVQITLDILIVLIGVGMIYFSIPWGQTN